MYSEAEAECERLKCLTTAKAALMKEVDMETWDEVEAAIPEFSRSEALQKFHLQKGKSLPQNIHMPTLLSTCRCGVRGQRQQSHP